MRPPRAPHRRADESGVSEIMGVTMLLAMVISTMAGVMVVMQPFMQDLTDNRDWSSGTVAATQFNDRLLVVAESPSGTGMIIHSQHVSDTIRPLRMAEIWQISADLYGDDRVNIELHSWGFQVTSLNSSATSISISGPQESEEWNLAEGMGDITTNVSMQQWIQIDVKDIDDHIIHRWIQTPLDGIQLRTPLSIGSFDVNLINGARIQQLPNQPIDVEEFPRLHHDVDLDGKMRVSIMLLDADIEGAEQSMSMSMSLDIESKGTITFFDEDARNLRISPEFTGTDNPESRYLRQWTDSYDLHRATGDSSEYFGFGPKGRVSGSEGLTLHPVDTEFHLDVVLQQVVVS